MVATARRTLGPLVPGRLRAALVARGRNATLRRELRLIGRMSTPALASDAEFDARLDRLVEAWNNPKWSAHGEYLRHIAQRVSAHGGAVLECGSGLSTLLLAAVAGRSGAHVWSLEHVPAWADRVRTALARYGLAGRVTVCDAPLISHGAYAWYTPPPDPTPLFETVVCDGPPGATPGGRFGLLPQMRDRLAPQALVLLDDAARPDEQAILARWAAEFGGGHQMFGHARPYAEFRMPGAGNVSLRRSAAAS